MEENLKMGSHTRYILDLTPGELEVLKATMDFCHVMRFFSEGKGLRLHNHMMNKLETAEAYDEREGCLYERTSKS